LARESSALWAWVTPTVAQRRIRFPLSLQQRRRGYCCRWVITQSKFGGNVAHDVGRMVCVKHMHVAFQTTTSMYHFMYAGFRSVHLPPHPPPPTGECHSAAWTSNGTAFSWGRGKFGQLGLAVRSTHQTLIINRHSVQLRNNKTIHRSCHPPSTKSSRQDGWVP
jgi:hypothetical protein